MAQLSAAGPAVATRKEPVFTWVGVSGRVLSQQPLPASGGLGGCREPSPFAPEYAHRLEIFAHNLAQAQKMEVEDLATAEFGMTPFSDLTGIGCFLDPRW